jgi:hypothetical protein
MLKHLITVALCTHECATWNGSQADEEVLAGMESGAFTSPTVALILPAAELLEPVVHDVDR